MRERGRIKSDMGRDGKGRDGWRGRDSIKGRWRGIEKGVGRG